MKSKQTVGYCPLTDKIHAGLAKNGAFTGQKIDVTPQAVEAIIHYVSDDLSKKYCRDVSFGDLTFRITVEPV